jgi:hypothetical protein
MGHTVKELRGGLQTMAKPHGASVHKAKHALQSTALFYRQREERSYV